MSKGLLTPNPSISIGKSQAGGLSEIVTVYLCKNILSVVIILVIQHDCGQSGASKYLVDHFHCLSHNHSLACYQPRPAQQPD